MAECPLQSLEVNQSQSPVEDVTGGPEHAIAPGQVRKARRGTPTTTACVRCRRSKVKCDGKRSSCSRCVHHSKKCVYDVPQEGVTRMQYLQQEIKRIVDGSNALLEIIEYLRCRTDGEAMALLVRLRTGESVESMLANLDVPPQAASDDLMPDTHTEASAGSTHERLSTMSTASWQSDYGPAMPAQHPAPDAEWVPPANYDEMWQMKEDVANLMLLTDSIPQVTFQGDEWPG